MDKKKKKKTLKFPKNDDVFIKIKEIWIEKWTLINEKHPKEFIKMLKYLKINESQALTGNNIKQIQMSKYFVFLLEKINELKL